MSLNGNPNDPLRLRYFNGLIMKEEEFLLEQDYHIRMRRLLTRQLHDGGIVSGLEVQIGNTSQEVLVTKGFALDRSDDLQFSEETSRELVLTDNCEVDLSTYSEGDQVWIWITYAEQNVDVVPDRGGSEPIHVRESAVINHSTTEPIDRGGSNIALAIVEIGPGGAVDTDSIKSEFNGQQIREKVAQKVDRVSTETLSLRDPEIQEENTPFLDGFLFEDTGDNGIVVTSERTRFTDRVDVNGPLFADGNAEFASNAVVNGNLTVIGDFAGRLPLGGVVAVFNYGSNLPATSNDITGDGFMLADGQALPATTALHAMASGNALPTDRPDLSNDVFLMGATSSGVNGGANSVAVTIPAHNHAVDDLDLTGNGLISVIGETGGIQTDNGLGGHTHTIFGVVDSTPVIANIGILGATEPNNNSNKTSGTANGGVEHTHSFSGASVDLSGLGIDGEIGDPAGISGDVGMTANAHENRPNYISAVYLIRVN